MKNYFYFFILTLFLLHSSYSKGQQIRISTITETWKYPDEIMYCCDEELDKVLIDHPKGVKEIKVKEKFFDNENPLSKSKNEYTFIFLNDSVVGLKDFENYYGVIRKNEVLIYDDKTKKAENFGRCIKRDSAGYILEHNRYFNNVDTSDYYNTSKVDEQGRKVEISYFVQADYHALTRYSYQGDSITHMYDYKIVNKDTLLMNDECTLKTSCREKNTWIKESKYTTFDYPEHKQTIKDSGEGIIKSKFLYDKKNRINKIEIYRGKTLDTVLEIEYK